MSLDFEGKNRKIRGASALVSPLGEEITGLSSQESALNYASCPDEFKQLIEDTDLDKLVYWKLKEKLEKQNSKVHNEILKGVLADVERPLFAIVLSKTNGNQSKAADVLGCNRNTLHRKLKEFFINPREIKRTIKNKPMDKSFFSANSAHGFKNPARAESAEL